MKNTIINHVYLYILFALLLIPFTGHSQNSLKKAEEYKYNYDYIKAIQFYHEYFRTNPPDIDAARGIAECYLMVNDTRSAEEWFAKVVSFDMITARDVLMYAGILKSEGRYEEAIVQYGRYASIAPQDSDLAEKMISSCRTSMDWINNPTFYIVSNADAFNSEYSDFGLMPFEDGYILTSDRKAGGKTYPEEEIYGWTGNPFLKLWKVTAFSKEMVSAPELIEDINNKYHNGPSTFDINNATIYYTRTKMVKVTKKPVNSDPTSWYDRSQAREYTNRLEIYSALYKQGSWQEEEAFLFNNAEEYSVGHPALSPDGNILYFVSDMPGGYGGTDIYFCTRNSNGKWSTPVNAGAGINTSGKEVFPFVDASGMLYFSSDGHPGMGGLDIFYSSGSKETWTEPVNMQYPVNSPKDDFSPVFVSSGKTGYLSSNRDGGHGSDDIYYFEYAPPVNLILSGIVKARLQDESVVPLPGAEVTVENISSLVSGNLSSGTDGTFITRIDCGDSYEVTATMDGYFANSTGLSTRCITRNDTMFVELILDQIVIDKPIVIENIYYDFDKWDIRADAALELNKLVDILMNNPLIEIELGSHTDSRGSDSYNERLSQRRAESAVTYIISRGIDPKRITAKGYGENVPVNNCTNGAKCTEDEFQMNRRTEFKVTKVNKRQ